MYDKLGSLGFSVKEDFTVSFDRDVFKNACNTLKSEAYIDNTILADWDINLKELYEDKMNFKFVFRVITHYLLQNKSIDRTIIKEIMRSILNYSMDAPRNDLSDNFTGYHIGMCIKYYNRLIPENKYFNEDFLFGIDWCFKEKYERKMQMKRLILDLVDEYSDKKEYENEITELKNLISKILDRS